MAIINGKKHVINIEYLTQSEVADRFRVTQSTVKNWRAKGLIKYFRAPGSSRVLYPVESIREFEQQAIQQEREVVVTPKQNQRKRPKTSTIPEREWRV